MGYLGFIDVYFWGILMKSRKLSTVFGVSVMALTLVWQPASAQAVLEEIIVTARKVRESIQDAPITVSAFTAEQIEEAGITQTADFIQLTPNVTLAESQTIGTSFLTVRGLSRVRNGELPVAVVVDDVLVVNARQFIGQVFDTEQIEVVKGPQGALYGRNASNGAIIITTKAPSEEPEGYIKASYGEADEIAIEGSFSGPVTDTLAVRLSGRMLERDGYFRNVTLDDETDPYTDRTLRGRVTWTPTDALDVDFKVQYSKHKGKGIGFHWPGAANFEVFGFFVGTAAELGVTTDEINAKGANLTGLPYVANNPDRGRRETVGFSAKLNYDLGFADFKSVTTYDELETSSVADQGPYLSILDGTQHTYVDVDGWSQELRLTSKSEGPLRWQAGAYYLSWDRLRTTVTGEDKGQGILRPTVVPAFENSTNPSGVAPGDFLSFLEDSYAWAVFGSIDWDVMNRLTLSLAARYDEETREQNVNPYNTAGRVYQQADGSGVNHPYSAVGCDAINFFTGEPLIANPMQAVNCGAYTTFDELLMYTQRSTEVSEQTYSKFQPKITLRYEVTDEINLYGSWGIGYRAGQFNYPGIGVISATAKEFIEQEENTAWELGAKVNYGPFRLNLAYFNSMVDNTQYFPFDGLAFVQVFEDIDEGELDGFEIEGVWRVSDNIDVYAAYGQTDGEITEYEERPATVGNELPYVAEYTINAGAHVEFNVFDGAALFARVDYERRGKQFWTPENTHPRSPLDLVNLRFGMRGDKWTLATYINNLTDEEYNSEVVTPLFLHPAPPRVWRVEYRYDF